MRKKLAVVFLITLFLLSLNAYSAKKLKKITRLGGHPFYKSKDLKAEDLYKIAIERAGDVKIGFEKAGYGDLVYPFLEQLKKAKIDLVQYEKGTPILWMLQKRGKRVYVKNDLVWWSKKPLVAYRFVIYKDYKAFEFIVPKVCGNISLKSITNLPVPKAAISATPKVEIRNPAKIDVCGSKNAVKNVVKVKNEKGEVIDTIEIPASNCTKEYKFPAVGTYTLENTAYDKYGLKSPEPAITKVVVWKNKPPVCALKLSSEEVLKGEVLTIDGSKSYDPDGKVVAMKVMIVDNANTVIEEKEVTEPPFVYKTKVNKVGEFKVQIKAKDDFGDYSDPACEAKLTVLKRFFILGEVGALYMNDPYTFAVVRGGFLYKFARSFGARVAVGPAIDLSGDYGTTPITADLTLNLIAGNVYVGPGVGVWYTSDESKMDLILNMGFMLTNNYTGINFGLFIEGRAFSDALDDISNTGRFGAGIRFLF